MHQEGILAFWAKLSRDPTRQSWHPLLCHLIDVAAVARAFWLEVLPPRTRDWLAGQLGLDSEAIESWTAWLAGLHDLGKASPAFQQKDRLAAERVRRFGFPFAAPPDKPHGLITAAVLPALLQARGVPQRVANGLATTVGGHHGLFPLGVDLVCLQSAAVGQGRWDDARRNLALAVADAMGVPFRVAPQRMSSAGAMFLAGLVSVADWIGSNEDFFPHAASSPEDLPALDLAEYAEHASRRAARALQALGWTAHAAPDAAADFATLFPFSPNQLQQAAVTLATRPAFDGPALVVVEAPMGEGKTEAALYLADALSVDVARRGMYVALPTQATSNQMFGRVREALERRFPGETVNLQLLHGHAALSAEFATLRERGYRLFEPSETDDGPDSRSDVIAAEWFTYRKRGLLAPFGVGTVDQALLAVLRTRHVFVRLFGLAQKTVIIDEVHAYDTYMSALLERLLEWLAALESPVILLSATLPRARRAALLAAYARGLGRPEDEVPDAAAYPRVSWLARDRQGARSVGVSGRSRKTVRLAWLDGRLPREGRDFDLGARLADALAEGGCAAVICNTVGRAQAVYQALRAHFPGLADDGQPVLDLLHARFPFEERQRREQRALIRFGREGGTVEIEPGTTASVRRPRRAVLVATQVIEQSLDLDFDLMVTDLAPADLILQRAGRLHRHPRQNRPARLSVPTIWIMGPPLPGDAEPAFDPGTAAVYDEHVLLRSWLALRDQQAIRIPEQIEPIIEAVYDERDCPPGMPDPIARRWSETAAKLATAREGDIWEARNRWIAPPDSQRSLARLTDGAREEDAPDFHQAHQALTRLAPPSVNLVCLWDTPGGPALDPEGSEPVDLQAVPDLRHAERLLRRSVTVANRWLVAEVAREQAPAVPAGWQRSALLRHHRPLLLDPAGVGHFGRWRITLDRELGIVVSGPDKTTEVH